MEGFLPIFFLLVVLKIPVFGALWLVWWASRAPEAEQGTAQEDDGGEFKRWRPGPARPRGPHSGPSGALGARVRARPAQLLSDRRERVAMDGHGSSARTRAR